MVTLPVGGPPKPKVDPNDPIAVLGQRVRRRQGPDADNPEVRTASAYSFETSTLLRNIYDPRKGVQVAPAWTREVELELARLLADGPEGTLHVVIGVRSAKEVAEAMEAAAEGDDDDYGDDYEGDDYEVEEPQAAIVGLDDPGAVVEAVERLIKRVGRSGDFAVRLHRVQGDQDQQVGVVELEARLGFWSR